MPVREASIEQYFIQQFEKRFPCSLQKKYELEANDPDRICLLSGGVTAFVELKRPKKTLRPGQANRCKVLQKLGFPVFWASTKLEVDTIIEQLGGIHEAAKRIRP